MSAKHKAEFVEWLRKNEPAIYYTALKMTPESGGVGGWLDDFVSTVQTYAPRIVETAKKVAPTVISLKMSRENAKRKAANKPPVNPEQFTAAHLATVNKQIERVNAGLSPAPTPNYTPVVAPSTPVEKFPQKVAAQSVGINPLYVGAAVLAALLILKK